MSNDDSDINRKKKTHKKAQSREEKGSRAQEREKQSEKKKRKEMQFFNALTGEAGIPDFQTSEQTHGYNTLH